LTRSTRADTGLRLIVFYKLVKAAVEALIGVLLILGSARVIDGLRDIAVKLREHAAEAWSVSLAERLVHAATARNMLVIAIASLVDAALSLMEGWALHRRYVWSEWLVVVATSCLIPFEVGELIRRVTLGRAALLGLNTLIVAYLLKRRANRWPSRAR
jgi:uncharacterized membrane protein (DUF2068 family)